MDTLFLSREIKQRPMPTNIIQIFKQFSRGRFSLDQYSCVASVEIFSENEKKMYDVNLKNVNAVDFIRCIREIDIQHHEPSLDLLICYINGELIGKSRGISDLLYSFKIDHLKDGIEFLPRLYFKIYSTTPIQDPKRESYGAKWIDYEKQLEKGTTIYDEDGINGIWAMSLDSFKKIYNNENVRKRYGDRFFILKTLPNYKYIENNLEIIGDRYAVLERSLSLIDEAEEYIRIAERSELYYRKTIDDCIKDNLNQLSYQEKIQTSLTKQICLNKFLCALLIVVFIALIILL